MTLATILILINVAFTLWTVANVKPRPLALLAALACPLLAICVFGLDDEDGDEF